MKSCDTALTRLYKSVVEHKNAEEATEINLESYYNKFKEAINDNLNFPLALSVLWDLSKIKPRSKEIYEMMIKFDKALGLDLENAEKHTTEEIQDIPDEIQNMAEERWQAKKNKDWTTADSLRNQLKELGYEIKDSADGYTINKI